MSDPSVPASPGDTLGERAMSGVMWTAAQRWAMRITGFVTIAILTRLLSPAEFGTVAIATSVLPMIYLLADMGFSTYIVQAKAPDQRMLSTAFWFTSAMGIVLAGALVAAAPVIGAVFAVPDAAAVVYGLVPAVFLVTWSTVPMALLRRAMRFRTLAMQSFAASLAGQVVAVVLALLGFGVWALIAQTVLNQFVASLFAWLAAAWRPSLRFSRAEFRAMGSFGLKVVGVEIIAISRGLIENAIITAALGVTGLGYLSIAQRLVQVAQDVTAAALLPVSTVVFAQVRDSADRLRSVYSKSLGLSYAVIIPVMVALALCSPIIMPALFGQQWEPSVAPAQVLAVVSIFVLGAMIDHGLFYGVGKPGRWLIYAAVIDGLTVVAALVTARHGLVVWALGFLVVAVVATVARWPLVARLIDASWTSVARVFGRAMSAGAVTAAVAFAAAMLALPLNGVLRVGIICLVVVLTHAGAMRLLMPAELKDGLRLVRSRLHRRGSRTDADNGPTPTPVDGREATERRTA